MTQLRNADCRLRIEFNSAEIEILRAEAEEARALRIHAGMRIESYQEKRLKFVSDYMRGAEPATREKQQRWLKKIKAELAAKRREQRKGA